MSIHTLKMHKQNICKVSGYASAEMYLGGLRRCRTTQRNVFEYSAYNYNVGSLSAVNQLKV